MRVGNPYADLRSLLDTTRRLSPEEMAELHLEQGFVDGALRIYDELARREPENASYATRRAWLARIASAERRGGRSRTAAAREIQPDGAVRLVVRAVGAPSPAERSPEATLHGVGPIEPAAGEERAPAVRAMRIVRVR